jgi:transmembrane sensor
VSHLEFPIKSQLRESVDEPALRRIWNRIDGRLPEARRRRRRATAGALALAGAAAVLLVGYARRDHGPLRLADGRALFAVDAPAEGARLSLSDGSAVELGGGARLEPLESSGSTFLAVLQRGSAAFDVRPGGPRRWQIECGLATVEVVGTRFSCERAPGRLRVSVQRGAVVVRGERVADRARRLAAGESLDVVEAPLAEAEANAVAPSGEAPSGEAPSGVAPSGVAPSGEAPSGEAPSAVAPSAEARRASPPVEEMPPVGERSSWRELARVGHPDAAFEALGAAGVRRETRRAGVGDLLALADVARLSGHPREAVAPLERILTDFAHDAQAPLAAFALGRLELDALDRPREAAAALESALALGVPRSLLEDVRARLVEAHVRAGDRAAARAAASAYLRDFPTGRHRAEMETELAPN